MEQITVKMERRGLSMVADRRQVALALKTWRLRRNITQKDLAQQWGVSRWTIIRIEKGEAVSWEMAYRIFAKLSDELAKEGKEGER